MNVSPNTIASIPRPAAPPPIESSIGSPITFKMQEIYIRQVGGGAPQVVPMNPKLKSNPDHCGITTHYKKDGTYNYSVQNGKRFYFERQYLNVTRRETSDLPREVVAIIQKAMYPN